MAVNKEIARGVTLHAKTVNAKKSKRHSLKKNGQKKEVVAKKEGKPSRFYPADDIPKPLRSAKTERNSKKTARLRSNIVPGTILILLSGRFRGKRVVFLKQLASGTLLVTGPYKVNGVPLRRVNQAYVIATSTKVDIRGVSIPESINDEYFARTKSSDKKGEEEFFSQASNTAIVSDQRKKDQKAVDSALLKKIEGVPMLKAYLNARFSLKKNDRPHEMKF